MESEEKDPAKSACQLGSEWPLHLEVMAIPVSAKGRPWAALRHVMAGHAVLLWRARPYD
jgi:hypothetical protein